MEKTENKQKILCCGDVEGRFDMLFKRVSAINAKSGPYDYLFCVGNFFGINNKEFTAYKTGEKKVPVPTYILGPNSADHTDLYPDEEVELCPNLSCLGKRGIFVGSKGLKVAYISGIAGTNSSDFEYSNKNITELYNACIRGNPAFRGVDLLLTSQWPTNVINNSTQKVSLTLNKTSDLPSWLVMKLKPRYHICGLEGVHFERAPFRCPSLGDHDTTLGYATRFVGLARVGNPNKDKWLMALAVTPLDKMSLAQPEVRTTDETECPYSFDELDSKIFNTKRKSTVGSGQYFYDTNAAEDEGNKNKKQKRGKIEFDQSKCWFCLASPSVEKHLIITVGNFAYLALAKGGIVDEHLLICPIEHYQNSLGQPENVTQEVELFKEAVRKFYARNGKAGVFYERNYKTSHMQLQAVPVPKQATRELQECFIEEAKAQGLSLQTLDSHNRLDQVVQNKVPYFTVELPDGTTLYTTIKGNFPLNFGREVLAADSILNLPERTDWKDCILAKPAEEALINKLRSDFEPFDFTM